MQPKSPPTDQSLLADLRRRRAELRDSMTALEHALAGPAIGDPAHWAGRVQAALTELSADLRTHVQITEDPDGLYPELLQVAPRLSEPVARLIREHGTLRAALDDLLATLDDHVPDVERVRELGTSLLSSLSHHRQRGADLVYEAYEVDVGGGED